MIPGPWGAPGFRPGGGRDIEGKWNRLIFVAGLIAVAAPVLFVLSIILRWLG